MNEEKQEGRKGENGRHCESPMRCRGPEPLSRRGETIPPSCFADSSLCLSR